MNCVLKKFILKQLNSVLKEKESQIQEARKHVQLWASRAKSVAELLEKLSSAFDDSQIDEKEAEQAVAAIQELVKSW